MQQSNDCYKQHIPPADRDIDKYAEKVCIQLSETKASFNYNPEIAIRLASFLKLVGRIEARHKNQTDTDNRNKE